MYANRFASLPDYPFARLRQLLDRHEPGAAPISLAIGEPQHPYPEFVGDILHEYRAEYGKYPPATGTPELRQAIADWLLRRFDISPSILDPERHVFPLNGTREGLFDAAIACLPDEKQGARPAVLIPNPFYQCYAAAALAGGAEPVFVDATEESGFLPDFHGVDQETLERTALVYICSPANPQGAAASADYYAHLYELADRFDFFVFSDECYSEIYTGQPPAGILEVSRAADGALGRVLAFHSLSKRSNLPGLRSGFCAGDEELIRRLKELREYGGAPNPLPVYRAAAAAWSDEAHVVENRLRYDEKFAISREILGNRLGAYTPDGGFFLWLNVRHETGLDGETAALKLWREAGLRVLPGAYLARTTADGNPGEDYIRVALVQDPQTTREALTRLADCLLDDPKAEAPRLTAVAGSGSGGA